MIPTRLLSILGRLARPVALAAVACAALAGTAVTTPASAWCCGGGWGGGWRGGGVFFGFPPIVVAPPIYAPPPVYYPPPPGYYPPQPPAAYAPPDPGQQPGPGPQAGGQSCYAGPYVCPMDHPVASGSGCYCLGNNRTQVWGRAS